MEEWRRVLRDGFIPVLGTKGLAALRDALRADDPSLRQGGTTFPPPLDTAADLPCEGACPVAFVGWKGEGLETVGDVSEFFGRACYAADERLGDPAECRHLLNWIDDTPRPQVIAGLLEEVERALSERATAAA